MDTTTPGIGHNMPPDPAANIFQEIQDLFDEAKNWADGEPIESEEIHDAITRLYDGLHDAGRRADALRKDEKKPLDEKIKKIQERFNPYIQPKKGKVDLGKSALGDLLAAWRELIAKQKETQAAVAREAADAKARAAEKAIRASRGNLEEREKAEELLKEAKREDKAAKRSDRAATTGTGLRKVWVATLTDATAALDWAYERDPGRFATLVQQLADEAVRGGLRVVPGFDVTEKKVTR